MRTVRTVVFWIHLVLGCLAGLIILAMSVTGILLAFERQIDAWADAPAVLQTQSQPAAQEPLQSVLANLSSSGQGVPSALVLHNNSKAPIEARFGRERTLYINPWTGEVIGEPSKATRGFFGSVERIHRSLGLGMRSAVGRGAIGAANLAFLFMILSGIYLWLPKLFNLETVRTRLLFRSGLKAKAREWNWHHVVGIWTALPLVFIVFTGVVMSYPWASNLLFTMTGSQPPAGNRGGDRPAESTRDNHRAPALDSPIPHFLPLEQLKQIATQTAPKWKSITIEVPQPDSQTVAIFIDKSVGGQPEQTSQLVLNRRTGHIDQIKRFSDNSTGRKLRAWARFTHTGEEFGLLGQIVAAAASLGAVLLVWTGISMALRRARSAQRIKRGARSYSAAQTDVEAQLVRTSNP